MKKFLIIALFCIFMLSVPATASQIGDEIGEAVYSDLTVYINNYPMASYVINNYAVVIAEDLKNYCCDVVYDDSSRTLNITKSTSQNEFNAPAVYKTSMETGAHFSKVLYTDIKTYINGNEVTSFNVDGRTMIIIDQFGKYMDGYTWDDTKRAAQAWICEKPVTEYKELTKRTEALYTNGLYSEYELKESYYGSHDFNFDGINENISINIVETNEDSYAVEHMVVNIGEYTRQIETYEANLTAVFVCDIDITDDVKDLVVITTEVSGDPVARILKFDNNLTQYTFNLYSDGNSHVENELWTGYVDSHYFNVNDDSTITVKQQTPSMGMWHVYKTYKRNQAGHFEEIVPPYYVVLPDIMKQRVQYDNTLHGYERTMWENGYIKAYMDYSGEGITINKGDYFKVLYDNGKDYIYVEKTDSQAGWIYITYEAVTLNQLYFMCAG